MKIAFLHNSAPSDFRVIGSHRFSDCHLRTWFSLLQFSRTCKTVTSRFQKASAVNKGKEKETFVVKAPKTIRLACFWRFWRSLNGSTNDDRLIFIGAWSRGISFPRVYAPIVSFNLKIRYPFSEGKNLSDILKWR